MVGRIAASFLTRRGTLLGDTSMCFFWPRVCWLGPHTNSAYAVFHLSTRALRTTDRSRSSTFQVEDTHL